MSTLRRILFLLLFFSSMVSLRAQCSVNAGNNIAICQNATLQLIATSTGNPTVSWTSNPLGGILSGGTTLTPTINTSSATQYILIISGSGGVCKDTIVATVNPLPNVTANASATTVCAGTALTLTGGGATTYLWSGGVTNGISFIPLSTTTYTVTGTGANNCSNTATKTITVKPLPTVTASANTTTVCAGTSVTLAGNGAITYVWSGGVTNGISFVPSSTTTYTVTGTGANNCSNTATKTITVNPVPDASIANYAPKPFTNCGGGGIFDLVVDNISTTTSTNSNYNISWGDNTPNYNSSTPPASLSHQYNGLGYFTLTLTVTGQNGCTSIKIYSVFNGSNPAVSFGNPGSTVELCIPYTLSFPISGTGSNPPGTIYVITKNDGTPNDTLSNPPPPNYTHIFSITSCGASGGILPNTFFVRIKAQNPCGNSTATIEPITTNQVPIANFTISPDTVVCINTNVTFANTSLDGATVDNNGVCDTTTANNWSISPISGWTLVSGTSLGINPLNPYNPNTWGSQNLIAKFSTPGIYNITLRVQGTNLCGYDSIVKTICVQSPPTPSFTATPMNGCSPLVVNFNNTSAGLNQCGTITRAWNVLKTSSTCIADSSNNFVYISGTNASSLNPIIRFNNQGTYTVTHSLTNICGTFTTLATTITVKRKPQVTITVPTNICLGQTVSPTTNTVLPCGDVISAYNWTFTGGSPASSNLQTPGTISYAVSGTKSISLDVTNSCGTTTVNATLNVLPIPISNAGIDKQFCSGGNTALGAAPTGGLTYQWTPSTGLSSAIVSNPTVTLTNTGSVPFVNTYILTVTNAALCTAKDTVLVTVNPLPNVTVTNATSICIGSSTTLTASGADTYSWSPTSGLNPTTGATVTANPITTTTYTVTGTTTSTSCFKTATVNVTVNPLPFVSAGLDQTLCNQPIPFSLTGTPSGGTWSGPNITAGGVFTPNGTGTSTVVYTFTNTNNCTSQDAAIITVNSPIDAHAGLDSTVCLNSTNVQLNGTPSGGTWSGSTLVSPGGLFTPTQTGTFNLIYSYGSGSCLRKDTMIMTVPPLPNVTLTPPVSICIGNSTPLTASGANTYNWNPTTGLNPTTGATVTANPITTTTYSVTGTTTSTSCFKTATVTVTVNPLPVVSAGLDQTLCNQPIPVTITGTPSGGTWTGPNITPGGVFTPNGTGTFTVVYTFTNTNNCTSQDAAIITVNSPTDAHAGSDSTVCLNSNNVQLNGTPSGGTWSGSTLVSPVGLFTPTQTGTFNLIYSYGSGSCLRKDTMIMTVNPLPNVTVTPPVSICIGNSTPLTASGANTYNWNPTTGLNPTTGATVTANPITTTTYSVTGTTASTSCFKTATVTVTVNPLPGVSAGLDQTLCNQPIPVTVTGTPSGGTWTGPNITPGGVFTPNGTGTFTVVYTFTNTNNCNSQDAAIITVNSPIDAHAGLDSTVCLNSNNIQLNGLPSGGTWSGSTLVSPTGLFTPTQAGTFNLIYSYGTGSCLRKDTMVMMVNPLPNVTVTPSTSFCIGNSTILMASGANTYSWGPSIGLSATIGATVTANPTATNTYTVTGTNTSSGCIKTATVTVTVNPLPVVNAGTDQTLCNQPIQAALTGTPSGGTWSGANITSGGVFTPNGTGTFPVEYTFTNTNSCTNRDTVIITVINPTNANAGVDSVVCLNSNNVQLNGTPSGGTWSGTNITSGGLFTPVQAGTFNLIYSYGTGTCLRKDTMVMMINPLPNVTVTASTSICIGFSTTLTASGADTYSWNPSIGLSATVGGTVTANPTATTTYTFTGTNNSTGCTKLATVTVTVNPLPIVAFSNPAIDCINIPVSFINTTTGANTYAWSFGDIGTATVTTPSHTYTLQGNFTIQLIAYTAFGCSDSILGTIQIIEPPFANFATFPDSGCAPLLVAFTNNSTGANTSFNWNFGNGNSSVLPSAPDQIYQQGLSDTTYHVSLSVTNQCGVSNYTDSVFVMPVPNVSFATNINSGCSPLAIFVSNTSSGNASQYIWDFGDGSAQIIAVNPGGHIFTTATNDTTYMITLIGNNSCGTDTVTKPILVHPDLVTAFFNTNSVSGCAPHTVTFANFSTGGTFISWNFGDGNVSTSPNPIHTYQNPGTYICYQYVNNGCSFDTVSVTITIYPKPALSFTSNVSSICVNEPVTFNNSSTNTSNFEWNFGDGAVSNLTSPSNNYATSGTFIVTLVGTSSTHGCIDSVKHPVTINALPLLQIASNVAFGCVPLTVTFNNNSQNGTFYNWDFDDGNTSILTTPTHVYNSTGVYTINVVAQNLQGCSDSTQLQINVYPRPSAAFTMNPNPECSPVTVNFTNTSSGAMQYLWDFGNGTYANTTDAAVTYTVDNTYPISLIASNTFGCSDTATNSYSADCEELFVPNALMPLDATTDARWFLPKGKSLKTYRLQIFNTWGTLLFETIALDAIGCPTEGWDGTFNGLLCQQDVYVWKIDATFLSGKTWTGKLYPSGEIKPTGTVTLIK